MLASRGVVRDSASKRASGSSIPARPAIATRWITALVEPPADITTRIALSKASHVSTSRGFRSSKHHLDDAAAAGRREPRVARVHRRHRGRAGQRHARATRSAIAIVEAVPIVMQVPGERAMPSSISRQAQSSIVPARSSAQYFHASLPLPRTAAAVVAAQHRARRQEDRRQVHAGGAHQQPGHGLVAAAHQHDAVDRVRAQQLLRLHRQQVAVEQRARLHERLADR